MTTAREDQYVAAIREAERIVKDDPRGFLLDQPGRPEVLARWAFRYAMERGERTYVRFCPHPGEARARTIFGCEPNHSYCAKCAQIRHKELARDARHRNIRECDFCHQDTTVVEICFVIAAVVVRAYVCGPCMLVPSVSGAV